VIGEAYIFILILIAIAETIFRNMIIFYTTTTNLQRWTTVHSLFLIFGHLLLPFSNFDLSCQNRLILIPEVVLVVFKWL
jgi:hypothetical protein